MSDFPFYLLLPMNWPYVISGPFNAPRNYSFAPRRLQLHEGIDLAPSQSMKGTPYVRASQRGIVDKIGWDAKGYALTSASSMIGARSVLSLGMHI